MIGQTTIIEKTVKCTAAIATQYTIAKHGADDDTYSLAVDGSAAPAGIFQHTTSAANDRVRLIIHGISHLKLGGAVTRGDKVTADAAGKGVVALLGEYYIGFVLASGVAGDIVPVRLAPGQYGF